MIQNAELRERATALGDEITSVLLELAEQERGFEGSGADRTLREAAALLATFRGHPLDDTSVAELARARSLLVEAERMIAPPGPRESVREAIDFVQELRSSSIELLVQAPPPDRGRVAPPTPPLVLSLGTPALIRGVAVATPRLLVKDDDELFALHERERADDDAAGRPGERPARSHGADEGERAQIEALARDAAEDLAALSTLRLGADDAPWKDAEAFEKRLLANIDALVALARSARAGAATLDIAQMLYAYASEWTVPDRGRTMAFSLTLACIDSDAALQWVTMGLRRAVDRAHPAYVHALALGSNPRIDDAIVSLLGADVPRDVVVTALNAAVRRRLFSGAMLGLASHPDPEIAALATRCLAFAPDTIALPELTAGAQDDNPVVRTVSCLNLNERGIALGTQSLRQWVDATLARDAALAVESSSFIRAAARVALRALAVNGDAKDEARVWVSARALASYRDVGFLGHIGHVPLLFSTLDELDKADSTQDVVGRAERAAGAIRRITGIAPPRFGSGRYDLPAFKAIWQREGPGLEAMAMREGRLRFGKPFARMAVVQELLSPSSRQDDRRILADELALASNGQLRFDVDGWTASQRQFLKMVENAWR